MDYSELRSMFNSSNAGAESALAVLGIFVIFIIILCIIAIAFKVIARWIFFKKCGEDGWKAIIPFYNDYVLLKISGLNWWWILIIYAGTILTTFKSTINLAQNSDSSISLGAFAAVLTLLSLTVSLASLFARINQSYNISKKFNKSGGTAVLLVLFEPIMLLVLGLSKNDQYDSSVEVSPNGLIGATPSASRQSVYCPDCGTEVKQDFCPNCGKKVR